MTRRFLFLQGPHGPFFTGLAAAVETAGSPVHRVLFNRGDRLFWHRRKGTDWYRGTPSDWAAWFSDHAARIGATDLVLYGDAKPYHAAAIRQARKAGLTIHVFEEGYLRPWWITYERDGANGHSPLNRISAADIARALATPPRDPVERPDGWGALWRHVAFGAVYHAAILSGGPCPPPHRDIPVAREARLGAARLARLPIDALLRRARTASLLRSGRPYSLVLCQLDHDASFRAHGPFPGTEAFLDAVLRGFAAGAPRHHLLAVKTHPLEDGRVPLPATLGPLAARHGLTDRVLLIPGGKLAPLLDHARSVVTVTSTAAQQALLRGIPTLALGRAIYSRPGFVSNQTLPAFFADPTPPDRENYLAFRQYLLETSQLPGSYYAARGRRQLHRRLPDILLAETDRYHRTSAAAPQHISTVTTGIAGKTG